MEPLGIKNHRLAVKKLEKIRGRAARLIKNNLGKMTEFDVQEFVFAQIKKERMILDPHYDNMIIAVNENSANPHYVPVKETSKIIEEDNLIKFDIWARLDRSESYFGDVTWMFFTGLNIPAEIKKIFIQVATARDLCLKFIRKTLVKKNFPLGRDIDEIVRKYFAKQGVWNFFIHNTGHSLGFDACHGSAFKLSPKGAGKILPEIPFTIEPGLYFPKKFGVRSEINCYITKNYKLIITSKVQKKVQLI